MDGTCTLLRKPCVASLLSKSKFVVTRVAYSLICLAFFVGVSWLPKSKLEYSLTDKGNNAQKNRNNTTMRYNDSGFGRVGVMLTHHWFLLSLLLFLSQLEVLHAILPTYKLDVRPSDSKAYSLLASQAAFGPMPAMQVKNNPARVLEFPPTSNPLLCENVTETKLFSSSKLPVMMVVPRGECTFELKAKHAQLLGADAILIYSTLASRYSVNKTTHEGEKYPEYSTKDIIYPKNLDDYDCDKGRAEVPAPDIHLRPLPYDSKHNDPYLSGDSDDNLCKLYSPTLLRNCDSKMCLLTGSQNDDNSKMEACCAWDLHVWLFSDSSLDANITIPAAFLTMEQGIKLIQHMNRTTVEATLSQRYRPDYNFSSMLIWAMGVFVAALAAYLSASDYNWAVNRILHRKKKKANNVTTRFQDDTTTTAVVSSTIVRGRSPSANSPERDVLAATGDAETSTVPAVPESNRSLAIQEESLELSPIHAVGFVIMASSGLMILFYFKIYNFVKVMYAFGCSSAVVQVLFQPICRKIAKRLQFKEFIVWRTGTVDFGDITNLDIISSALGYTLGFSWLYVAFFVRNPEELTFYWVVQDIMGSCMCIVFLTLIKLNSIRVASILLIVAFVYDIFFVFVTPLLFQGKSVMITVATSGGPPKADPSWCEKYPDDIDCQGGQPLPMLLTVPRIGDYQGGASLLGLGDIVLPGLLLSFAARLDAAKSLVGLIGGGNGPVNSHSCPERKFCMNCGFCSGGYLPPLVVAYAIGLLMANMAVYLMEMGQPALLYLVPCTLGTMAFMGWRRNELFGLWEGPRILNTADEILYGRRERTETPRQEEEQQQPSVINDGDENDETGDVPLLSRTAADP